MTALRYASAARLSLRDLPLMSNPGRSLPDGYWLHATPFCHRDLHRNTGRFRDTNGHRPVTSPCDARGNGNLAIGVLGVANPGLRMRL
jgi:hypothetical protein